MYYNVIKVLTDNPLTRRDERADDGMKKRFCLTFKQEEPAFSAWENKIINQGIAM